MIVTAGEWLAIPLLQRLTVLDVPWARSSHQAPGAARRDPGRGRPVRRARHCGRTGRRGQDGVTLAGLPPAAALWLAVVPLAFRRRPDATGGTAS